MTWAFDAIAEAGKLEHARQMLRDQIEALRKELAHKRDEVTAGEAYVTAMQTVLDALERYEPGGANVKKPKPSARDVQHMAQSIIDAWQAVHGVSLSEQAERATDLSREAQAGLIRRAQMIERAAAGEPGAADAFLDAMQEALATDDPGKWLMQGDGS